MKEIFINDNTKILTVDGLMYCDDIEISDDGVMKPSLFLISDKDELISSKYYSIQYRDILDEYLNVDSTFNLFSCNKENVYTENSKNIITDYVESDSCTFDIDEQLIDTMSYTEALSLMLTLESMFKYDDETKTYVSLKKIDNRIYHKILTCFSERFNIHYDFNSRTKTFKIKSTRLHKPYEIIEKMLIHNIHSFKEIYDILTDCNVIFNCGYNMMYFNNYRLASIFQVLTSLCGNSAKLQFDKSKKLFKVIFYDNTSCMFNSTKKSIQLKNKDAKRMFNIILSDCEGKLILSQTNMTSDGSRITTISLINADSTVLKDEE